MEALIASKASDAAQNVADSLDQEALTGWDLAAAAIVAIASIPFCPALPLVLPSKL